MQKEITYPQYRKYPNGKTFFKILSEIAWEEIQVIGRKYILQKYTASILPDRNYINDLTFDYKNNWKKIDEVEYELAKSET